MYPRILSQLVVGPSGSSERILEPQLLYFLIRVQCKDKEKRRASVVAKMKA